MILSLSEVSHRLFKRVRESGFLSNVSQKKRRERESSKMVPTTRRIHAIKHREREIGRERECIIVKE